MKVIVAGFCKTGTKSVAAACRLLGFNVYDYEEHAYLLGDEWMKILSKGGTAEDFQRMYNDVDVVTDVPTCFFWEELHKAFPDAKIIFMQRQSEEVWLKSMRSQIKVVNDHWIMGNLAYLSPTMRKMHEIGTTICRAIYGWQIFDVWPFNYEFNPTVLGRVYRMHNAHVLHCAPRDRFLIYDVKEGWEPLCKFLQLEVPDVPFPHENVKGQYFEKMLESSPMMNQIKKEVIIVSSLIVSAVGLLIWLS